MAEVGYELTNLFMAEDFEKWYLEVSFGSVSPGGGQTGRLGTSFLERTRYPSQQLLRSSELRASKLHYSDFLSILLRNR